MGWWPTSYEGWSIVLLAVALFINVTIRPALAYMKHRAGLRRARRVVLVSRAPYSVLLAFRAPRPEDAPNCNAFVDMSSGEIGYFRQRGGQFERLSDNRLFVVGSNHVAVMRAVLHRLDGAAEMLTELDADDFRQETMSPELREWIESLTDEQRNLILNREEPVPGQKAFRVRTAMSGTVREVDL